MKSYREKYKITKNFVRGFAAGAIVSGALFAGAAGYAIANEAQVMNKVDDLKTSKELVVDWQEYVADELTGNARDYRDGEISLEEFNEKSKDLEYDNAFLNWLKSSKDRELSEEANKLINKNKELDRCATPLIIGTGLALTGSVVGLIGAGLKSDLYKNHQEGWIGYENGIPLIKNKEREM